MVLIQDESLSVKLLLLTCIYRLHASDEEHLWNWFSATEQNPNFKGLNIIAIYDALEMIYTSA